MNKALLEQLEFEKSKRKIIEKAAVNKSVPEETPSEVMEGHKYAWEYELEQYRKTKIKERFYMIGAVCGILSLGLNLVIHFQTILTWF